MKSRLWNWLPLTREGLLWFLISFAMLVTGLLKGINLITLLACWMVILVLLNYWWAYPQLRFIAVRRLFTEAAFAETPFTFLLQVDNPGEKNAFGISIRAADPNPRVTRFLPRLRPQTSTILSITLKLPRRGRYPLGTLEVTSGYPLALVQLVRSLDQPADLIVYPRLGILQRASLRQFLAQHSPTLGQARTFPRRHPGAQTEFHGLRPFRVGDSPRWIHWRTTARRGELMVREFEDMPNDHLVLVVDAGSPDNPLLERQLSLAATICWEWCRQKDNRLALVVADAEPTVFVGNKGYECACSMLERLALVNTGSANDTTRLLEELAATPLPPGPVLLLSLGESALAEGLARFLHRSVAQLNLGAGDENVFFE